MSCSATTDRSLSPSHGNWAQRSSFVLHSPFNSRMYFASAAPSGGHRHAVLPNTDAAVATAVDGAAASAYRGRIVSYSPLAHPKRGAAAPRHRRARPMRDTGGTHKELRWREAGAERWSPSELQHCRRRQYAKRAIAATLTARRGVTTINRHCSSLGLVLGLQSKRTGRDTYDLALAS